MIKKRLLRFFLLFILLIAVILLIVGMNPKKRAEQGLELLYTVKNSDLIDFGDPTDLEEIYHRKFENYLTEDGIRDAVRLRLPYGLLNRDTPVRQTQVKGISLNRIDNLSSVQRICYTFSLQVITEYDVGNVEVTNEVRETEGSVWMRKTGMITWKIDKIAIK